MYIIIFKLKYFSQRPISTRGRRGSETGQSLHELISGVHDNITFKEHVLEIGCLKSALAFCLGVNIDAVDVARSVAVTYS